MNRPFSSALGSWGAFSLSAALLASPAFADPRYAFVTSTFGTGDLSTWGETDADGLAGADQICQVRAAAGGLANSSLFRAWISTSTVDAYCHLQGEIGTKADNCDGQFPIPFVYGPWLRMDDTPFANNLGQMTGTGHEVYQPVLFDETGTAVADVEFWNWTGTDENGEEFGGHCNDWSSAASDEYGGTGIAWFVGGGFTYDVSLSCDQDANTDPEAAETRLLCLEADQGEPQKLPSESGALAFVTSVIGNGKLSTWADTDLDGLAGGDEICQARAAAAKLPNPSSFVAWLSDSTTDAKDRVTVDGPFVRVDGFLVAPSKNDLLGTSPDLRTGLNVDELGRYYVEPIVGAYVWTGTDYDGTEALDTCDDWTSNLLADQGTAGSSATTRYTWSSNGSPYCSSSRPIYCFSNVEILFWDNFERGNTSRWSNGTV